MKYINYDVVFQEVPNEITLAINISNCPCHCKGCHSPYLAEDVGDELTKDELDRLLVENKGITCVAFMGGDADPESVNNLAFYIRVKSSFPYKVAWYSGKPKLPSCIYLGNFDFIKLGPYNEELGPLTSSTTNQRFYKVKLKKDLKGHYYDLTDITKIFWKNNQ